ncbi:MAG: helix-hairpin-helix domain-containing protein [Nitrospirales bacterium]|nr:helix-hairpin-helix domain-containing protein [Nitrospirales bacterium]
MIISETNRAIAERLKEVADLLHDQGSNPFRVQAYRHAAHTLEQLERSVDDILRSDGLEGLKKLPAIGESLSRSIKELMLTGKLPMLQRLRGEAEPVALLSSIPGIGKKLAEQLHHDLGIDTLEELEVAAHEGRLAQQPGIGEKRLKGIIASLGERLGRVKGKSELSEQTIPSIEEILDVDNEYREKAVAGKLHKFAPRRFNPSGEAWLPVLHTQRGKHHFTALYSNTARAHKKGKTHDWVVLYYDDGQKDSQCTVITADWGILEGRRIVSGRESACLKYYEEHESKASEVSRSQV